MPEKEVKSKEKVEESSKEEIKEKTPKDISPTGIKELDQILNGGFPKGSVVLVSGAAGSGKTLLSFEWLFNGVTKFNQNGIYVTFTEPLFKTLKNLESMSFYKRSIIEEEKIKILDIRKEFHKPDFNEKEILNIIEEEVKKNNTQRLVIDSISAFAYNLETKARIRKFIFNLGTMLASLGITTMLISEAAKDKQSVYGVEEFISDGIITMKQDGYKFQSVRSIEILKMRGINYQRGISTFRITKEGIKIFPQLMIPLIQDIETEKISIGVSGLDKMTNGGVYKGSTNLIAGSTGSGKSILGLHFVWEGLKKGEPCLLAGFEESRGQILRNANAFGFDFETYEKKGLLKIMTAYPSQKYIEEHLLNIKEIVDDMGIKRCVIDSLSSIGNSFEKDQFRYFVKRLNGYLKYKGVTSVFTTATASLMAMEKLTAANLSTMTDNIFLLKYVEAGGEIKLMMTVLKTRGHDHSKSLKEYKITNKGIVIGESFKGYESIMTGSARKVSSTIQEQLKEMFIKYLGPIGITEFEELKEKQEINKESIIRFIESLIEEKSLNLESGEKMISETSSIFGSKSKITLPKKRQKSKIKEDNKKSLFSAFFNRGNKNEI